MYIGFKRLFISSALKALSKLFSGFNKKNGVSCKTCTVVCKLHVIVKIKQKIFGTNTQAQKYGYYEKLFTGKKSFKKSHKNCFKTYVFVKKITNIWSNNDNPDPPSWS